MKLAVSCNSFEKRTIQPDEGGDGSSSFLRMYTKSSIPYTITCGIRDSENNMTNTKTPVLIEWSDPNIGKSVTRPTKTYGEAIFPANSVRCNIDIDKAILWVRTPDLQTVEVRSHCIELYKKQRQIVTGVSFC